MQTDRAFVLILVVALVALAGCVGGDGGGAGASGDGAATTAGSAGGGSSTDWCVAGQSTQMTNPQTGEQVTWQVRGVVTEDGHEACRVTWETNQQGDVQRMDLYFTEDQSYRKMVSYDADGTVVNEVRMGGDSMTMGEGGDSTQMGSGDDTGWCGESGSMQFTDPQTGEQASFDVQGVVDHEGRQVCKAVWETNQGEVQRVEMYYTEDRSYQHLVYYDAAGNVVNEVRVGG